MGDDVTALLVAIARENADLRQQLATAQDMLMETAIDVGNLHAMIEAVQAERDAWRDEDWTVHRTQSSNNVIAPSQTRFSIHRNTT